MIDDDPKHVEAAYQAAVHRNKETLYERIKKLEVENQQLQENEKILAGLLSTSEAQMVKLWDEILRLQEELDQADVVE